MIRTDRQAGFTLVELLVALALSALVGVILLNGVRLAATGLDRHTSQSERFDARRSLDDILRRSLSSAALVSRTAGSSFVGRPDAIGFLSVAEDSGPGLYHIVIAVDRSRDDRPLVLRRSLAAPAGDPRAAASVLLAHVREFRLAYFGADSPADDPTWHDRWEGLALLPSLVRVVVVTDGDLPRAPLVIRLWNAG